jgi:cell division transport system permease protein
MRASYLMSGVATGLRRNASMTVALVLSTGIALLFLGGALLINKEISKTQSYYEDKLNVSVFLCNTLPDDTPQPGSNCKHKVTEAERAALEAKFAADSQIVSSEFVTVEKATAIARERLGAKIVDEAGPGAIPSSYTLKLKDIKHDFDSVAARYATAAGVDRVQNQDVSLKTMLRLFDTARRASFAMFVIVLISALILMANTIQAAAQQRRNETGIMRLVGASRWMTQLPFVIEAVLAAVVGAVLAMVGLWIAKVVFLDGQLGEQVRGKVLQPLDVNDILVAGSLGLFAGMILAAVTAWGTLRLLVRL